MSYSSGTRYKIAGLASGFFLCEYDNKGIDKDIIRDD